MKKNSFSASFGMVFFVCLLLISCQDYTPKPTGYNRIEPQEAEIKEYIFPAFSFNYTSAVRIDTLKSPQNEELWFNIVYPQYNAVIYCTYFPITRQSLPQALEDSYHMAYSHTLRASGINQKLYNDSSNQVSGTVYEIEGNVATPAQFFVTDSVNNFLRGSFYYSAKINADSVAPVTEFITKDIENMISSFRWRNRK